MGDESCLPIGPTEFTTNYGSPTAAGCYQVDWTLDGEATGPNMTLAAGEHNVGVRIRAQGKEISRLQRFKVCPAPRPIEIGFERRDGACSPDTICAGRPCRIGQPVHLLVRYAGGGELKGCEKVRWFFEDRETDSSAATTTRETEGDEVVRVRLETGGGATEARTLIRYASEAPDPCPALGEVRIIADSPGGYRPKIPIHFSLDPSAYPGSPCDTVTWVFDDGTTASGPELDKTFEEGGDRKAHVVVTRAGEVRSAMTSLRVWCPIHGKRCRPPRQRLEKASAGSARIVPGH